MPPLDQMLKVPPSLGHAQLSPVACVPGHALCRLRVKVGRKVLHHLLQLRDCCWLAAHHMSHCLPPKVEVKR